MISLDYSNKWDKGCPKVNCRKDQCTGLQYVFIPATMGDDSATSPVAPKNGAYCNAIVLYEATKNVYIYSKEGVPTKTGSGDVYDFNNLINRPFYAGSIMNGTTNIPEVPTNVSQLTNDSGYQDQSQVESAVSSAVAIETAARQDADGLLDGRLTTVEGIAATALQPAAIDKVVMTDLDVDANPSTTTIQLDAAKENLLSGTQTTKNIALPVASSTQAGVMNAATYDAITKNTQDIANLMGKVVAVTGLSANPTQSELTTAWLAASGEQQLINGAGIYDVSNVKVWTYYENDTTWHGVDASGSVQVSTFTNVSEGLILGSVLEGQVFAENNGTGSVNGWDSLKSNVSTNTSNITSLQTGKQDKLTAGDNITISQNNTISTKIQTIFYANSSESGATRHIYKRSDMTGEATMQDIINANEIGQVILRLSTAAYPETYSDAYLQNAYVANGDYQMLFLNEKAYVSYDTTAATDTLFYYSRRVMQQELTAGNGINITGATISTDYNYETFTFTMVDNTVVTKNIAIEAQ